jgi:hypothetical protein
MANPLLDALLADRYASDPAFPDPITAPTPEAGARMIDFATPLPEAAPLSGDKITFPNDEETSLPSIEEVNRQLESPSYSEPSQNPILESLFADQQAQATQQAVTEATTPDENLPVLKPDLADALGVLDYRDPQEGARRAQAAALGEILGLPEYEKVQLGAAPVNDDGTVTIRRAQAVSPEAQAAADQQMAAIQAQAAADLAPPSRPVEYYNRAERGARLGVEDVRSGFYSIVENFFKDQQNPYLYSSPQTAEADVPKLESRLADLQQRRTEFVKGDLGPNRERISPFDQEISSLSSQLEKARQATTGEPVTENFLGSLSRASADLSTEARDNQAAIRADYTDKQITPERDKEFWMTVADSLGRSAPTTATAILNPFLGLTLGYTQVYSAAEQEFDQAAAQTGKPLDPAARSDYAHSQALLQTPFELVGDLALAKVARDSIASSGQALIRSIRGGDTTAVSSFVANLPRRAGQLGAAAAGETLITTPAQTIIEQKVAESAGVRDPISNAQLAANTGQAMKVAAAQSLLLGGGPVALETGVTTIADTLRRPAQPPVNPQVNPPPAPAEVPQNFTPISSPAPSQVSNDTSAPAPRTLGQVRAPQIAIDQAALDEAFGPATGTPPTASAPAASAPIAPEPTGSPELITGEGAAFSFTTNGITPEQQARTDFFAGAINQQLRTQGVLQPDQSLTLQPVALDRVDAGAGFADFLEGFQSITGTTVQFVKPSDPTIFGGAVRSDDARTIFINAESQRPALALIGHEWGHTIQNTDPALYKELRRVVARYTDDYRSRAREAGASPLYQGTRAKTAELTNNTLGDAFLDPEFWNSLRAEDQPMAKRLWENLTNWFNEILARSKGTAWGTEQFATNLSAMRRDLARVARTALRPPTQTLSNAEVTTAPVLIDLALEAHHGTPHKVDRFSTQKVGAGEGAQVYGWGLYFAQNPKVAEEYRSRLTSDTLILDGISAMQKRTETGNQIWGHASQYFADGAKTKEQLLAKIKSAREFEKSRGNKYFNDENYAEVENAISKTNEIVKGNIGNLYTVELNVDDADLLDWDKPLSEQSAKVRGILQKWADDPELWESMKTWKADSFYGANLKDDAAKQKSEFLLRLGIPGIRYLDQGSRLNPKTLEEARARVRIARRDAENSPENAIRQNILKDEERRLAALEQEQQRNTYNYVVFDENLIKIKAENGQPISRESASATTPTAAALSQAAIPSISFASEPQYKPTDLILSPTGHKDWGVFTDQDEANSQGRIKSLPIRLLKGNHFGPNKGFGIEHIIAEHKEDFEAFSEPLEKMLHRVLLDFNEVYLQPNGKLALISRRPTIVSVVELREEKDGFYSVITSYPKENPSWNPAGVRILDGRRAAFAQSARAPGPTAQGIARPKPPLEPLPGKYSVEYAMSLRQAVNKNVDLATEPKPRKFSQSLQAAPGVTPEIKSRLTSLDYDPVSNAETLANARARIDSAGSIDAAFTDLMGKPAIEGWQPTAEDYATGMELMAQLQNRNRHADAASIANMMASRATDQGRAIQALSMIARLGPQGIELFAQQQLVAAATKPAKSDKQKADIQAKITEAGQLQAEVDKLRRDSTTAAIVANKDLIKSSLPAGVDAVQVNLAIREAILASPTPLAAQAATSAILTGQGLSEKGAARIAGSIVRDFLKTTQDTRATVLQDLLATAESDRRLDKSKLGSLIRLNREGQLTEPKLHAAMAKMLGIPHWSAEHSAKVQRILAQREKATDPRIKLVKAAEALDVVYREFMPPGFLDKVDAIQTIAMLLNPKTVIRNVVGNALMAGADLAADAVSVPMDALLSLGTGQRTRTGLSLGERLLALGAGVGDIQAGYNFARSEGRARIASIAEGVDTLVRLGRLQSSGKYNSSDISALSGPTFTAPGFRQLESTLGLVLSISDRGFYESSFRASLDTRMKAAAANGTPMLAPDADMVTAARMDAARAIYQDDNAASRTLGGLRRVLNFNQRWGIGSLLMKFTQVPGSILTRAVEFSPLGFIRTAYESLAPMLSSSREFDQKAFTDSFSRAVVGTTGLVATGYWLAHLGIISAGGDAKDEDKRNLNRAMGWGSYKLNIDALKRALMTGNFWTPQKQHLEDRTESYDWAQPLSIGIAMGAYARENQEAIKQDILAGKKQSLFANGLNWLAYAGGAATGAMNSLVEQPLLTGLNQFARDVGYDNIPGALLKTAADAPGTFIPTAARQWMQLTDNSVRETRDSSPTRQFINELKSQLPGLSKTLPQKYDIAGQPVERWAKDSNTLFNVLFNPSMVTYIKGSQALTEMSQVYKYTAETGAIPNQIKPEFTLEGVKVRLTSEEISAMQKDMGALSIAALEKFVLSDPRYDKATWDAKARAMTRALEIAAKSAKYRILLSRPDLKSRAKQEYDAIQATRAATQADMLAPVGP